MNQNLPELNVSLLEAVSAKIADEPENFDMGEWVCGTSRCIAGHALALNGLEVHEDGDDIWCFDPETGARITVDSAAREALGLTRIEAAELFYNTPNDVDGARRTIKDLIESRQGGAA